MTDMKTALTQAVGKTRLQAVIDEWEQDTKDDGMLNGQPPVYIESKDMKFQTTTGVTEKTFNFINDNPGLTVSQIAKRMQEQGFNSTSVSSLCAQMVKNKLVRKDEDKKLHSLGKKYKPLTRILPRPKQQKPAGLPALVKETADPRPVQSMIDSTPKPWGTEASNVLTRINVVEARILYEELKKIFGG